MKTANLRALGGRLARSILGASVAGLVGAFLDTSWARAAGDGGAAVGSFVLFSADAGLLAPVGILVGLAVGLGSLLLDPSREPTPGALIVGLRTWAIGRPADVAAFVPLAVIAAFFWTTLSAHLARALLALEVSAPLAGIAIAAGVLAIGMLFALAALTLTPPLRRALATASERHPDYVDPAVTGAVGLVVSTALFVIGIATGGVSGEGGLLGIYGVFKRPELDLRAAAMVLTMAVAALFAPAVARRVWGPIAIAFALATLVLTVRSASALNAAPAMAQAIERGAPLGKIALKVLRGLTDRDGDGASGSFGGGDCQEGNPAVGAGADEILDNGIDEDCSGSDLTSASIAKLTPPPLSTAALPAPRAAVPPDLNLVLITVDTLRSDLGYAGNPRPVSPNLDKLAARSAVFDRAYALASYTGKSVGPMLIGKYGTETHRNWGHFNKFGTEDTFLAERLKRAGVDTLAVHGHRYFGAFGGLERGFDVLDLSAAPPVNAKWDVDSDSTSPRLTDAAIALINAEGRAKKRFFLWVHYLDPHADYVKHDDVPSFGGSQRDLYDGEVAFTDKHIGRLLDALKAAPFADRTAIVVTSDHGEAFGEHKMFRHGFELWEELVRVPLIVHVPGAPPSRVTARRGAIDLVPTALELMSVPLPSGSDPDDFLSGTSLLADVFVAPGVAPAARDVLIDMPAGPYNDARRSLIRGDLKLTVSNDVRFELYDLAIDPEERRDLSSQPEGKEMKDYYAAVKARLREIRVTGPKK